MRRLLKVAALGASVGVLAIPLVSSFSSSSSSSSSSSWSSHVPKDAVLEQSRDGVVSVVSSLFGMPRLRRAHVVRLRSGGLMVHSATCVDEPMLQRLLGDAPVELIVVPCAMHRLDARLWKDRFPNAKVVCPDGAETKVAEKVPVDATFSQIFGANSAYPEVRVIPTPMGKGHEESVLVVRMEDNSSAWLVTDFLQNVDTRSLAWILRKAAALYGIESDGQQVTCSKGFRYLAGGSDVAKKFISSLDVQEGDTLHFCHGESIVVDARSKLQTLANKL